MRMGEGCLEVTFGTLMVIKTIGWDVHTCPTVWCNSQTDRWCVLFGSSPLWRRTVGSCHVCKTCDMNEFWIAEIISFLKNSLLPFPFLQSKALGQTLLSEVFLRGNQIESDYFGLEFQNMQMNWVSSWFWTFQLEWKGDAALIGLSWTSYRVRMKRKTTLVMMLQSE